MDSSTSTLRTGSFPEGGMSGYFLSIPCFIEIRVCNANSADPDETMRSTASDLGLHCFPMSTPTKVGHRDIRLWKSTLVYFQELVSYLHSCIWASYKLRQCLHPTYQVSCHGVGFISTLLYISVLQTSSMLAPHLLGLLPWSWFHIYTPIYKRLTNFVNACTPPSRSSAVELVSYLHSYI